MLARHTAQLRLATLCATRVRSARVHMTTTSVFKNHQLEGEADIQFLRSLGYTYEMGGDVNEMMLAAQACEKGDDARKWHDVWDALARRTYTEATGRIEKNPVGAASALLRTCNYARTSAFFLRGTLAENERVKQAYALSNKALSLAAPHLDPPLTAAALPMRDGSFTMPAYYAKANAPPVGLSRSPLFVCMEGYDSDMCEAYLLGKRATSYGFNLLCFEGPGQGASAPPHTPGLHLRHDIEAVVASALDAASSVCGFDPEAGVVVYGASLGGYFTARSSIFETRPAAYVCDPFNPSLKSAVQKMLPPFLWDDLVANEAPGSAKTKAAFEGMGAKMYHKLASRAQAHGIDVSQSDFAFYYLRESLKWHVDVAEYERLQVPLIMLSAEEDTISGSGMAEALKPHLDKSPAGAECALIPMKASEGAGLHISIGARSLLWERMMDELLPLLRKKLG